MGVRRAVPDLSSTSLEAAKAFYGEVLGLRPVMDHGWIVTLADPERPQVQVSLMTDDATGPVIPDVSIQVDDVDGCHDAALRAGAEIVHPLTDEPWGVRRFFVRAPDGHVINVRPRVAEPTGLLNRSPDPSAHANDGSRLRRCSA